MTDSSGFAVRTSLAAVMGTTCMRLSLHWVLEPEVSREGRMQRREDDCEVWMTGRARKMSYVSPH